MPLLSIRCPQCARPYGVDSRLVGRTARCKHCGTAFPVTQGDAGVSPPGAGSPSQAGAMPERLGRYRLLRKLGEGGMGAVFLARDEQLQRDVALKVPHFTARDGPDVLDRFTREARAAATLHHPNLCPVYDVGESDGIRYLTMPYIEGRTLAETIDPDRPIATREAARLVRTMARALQEAHARGVIHRDLKPANVMIDRRGQPILMDFGLARLLDRGDPRLTRTGAPLGTPHYMAPEQMSDDPGAAGPSCDIYGLGTILYELLAGRRPFDGPIAAVLACILFQDPPRPSERRPEVAPALEAICLKAMAKAPRDRFASMAEFAEALDAYLGQAAGPEIGGESPDGAALPASAAPAPKRPTAGPDSAFDGLIFDEEPISRPPARTRRRGGRRQGAAALAAAAAIVGILGYAGIRGPRTAAPAGKAPRDVDAGGNAVPARDRERDRPAPPPPVATEPAPPPPSTPREPPAVVSTPTPAPAPKRPTRRALVARRDESEIRDAIRGGVRYLIGRQNADGSWPDAVADCPTGTTSLVTLALLAAGEAPDSPAVSRAIDLLRGRAPNDLGRTYSVALRAMVLAAAEPMRYRLNLAADVTWLERAQIKPGDRASAPGSWTYTVAKSSEGDLSNTQFAILALDAARRAGVPVKPEVWTLAREFLDRAQRGNGGWGYHLPENGPPPAPSQTCAGTSGEAIASRWRSSGFEVLAPDGQVRNCGAGATDVAVQRGLDFLAANFRVDQNRGAGNWTYYYLAGLERTARLTGRSRFGAHDWYAEGARHLLTTPGRNASEGSWAGGGTIESDPLIATSFALLFLARGGEPVLVTKLRHDLRNDWRNDPRDVANLVEGLSGKARLALRWAENDPETAELDELQRSPVLFFNGHAAPTFGASAKAKLRAYVEGGGTLFVEACCGKEEFDRGFRTLVKELFPGPESELRPLPADHPIWTARHALTAESHPLWGITLGDRAAVVYSPSDLSCLWQNAPLTPDHPHVARAVRVGENVLTYAADLESLRIPLK